MAEKNADRLVGLVKKASWDLIPEVPIRHGRGLEGMIADNVEVAYMSTSREDDKMINIQESKQTSKSSDKLTRSVRSYRVRDDLTHRIDVLAAQERRKIYEVIEEALDLYLRARNGE